MENREYELFLDRLSLVEYFDFREEYHDYVQSVILMLDLERNYTFEDDVLHEQNASSMDEILARLPARYFNTGSQKKKVPDDKESPFIRVWYDVNKPILIDKKNFYYDQFFAYRLRQMDLMKVDGFLEFHSQKWGAENLEMFLRFVSVLLHKYEGKLLTPTTILTSMEWIGRNTKPVQLSGTDNYQAKTKGKLKREANDGQTSLSQEQTALLIDYAKRIKIFRRDEYLYNREAGLAFNILTGYDSEAMRQTLGDGRIAEIKTEENLTKLTAVLVKMSEVITKDLEKK